MNKLEIADEAAPDVTKARVVDVRCLEPDATRVMVFFRLGRFEVAIESGQGTAEDIEGDDAFY